MHIMTLFDAQPTVTPEDDFDPERDCRLLNEAMDGCGTSEGLIIRILANR